MKKNDSGTNNESGKSEAVIQKQKKEDIAFQAKAALLSKEATHRFSAEFWIEKPNLHNRRIHSAG